MSGRKIYININDQEKIDEARDKGWVKKKKSGAREGYDLCSRSLCSKRFPVYSSKVNGHPGFCCKKCMSGAKKKDQPSIRDIERNLTPQQRRFNRQKRRVEKILNPDKSFYDSDAWRSLRYPILRKFKFMCLACGNGPRPGKPLHVDHIKPRSKYPELELDPENLQVLCQDCNLSKGNLFEDDLRPEEYRGPDFLTDAAKSPKI